MSNKRSLSLSNGRRRSRSPVRSKKDEKDYIRQAPFSDEEEAIANLHLCDYDIKISLKDAKNGNATRKIRVYADGVYDMFHSGHARQLMQAKNAFPNIYLIVGVCNDKDTNYHKGQTVMNENERYEAMKHCRYVDEIIRDAPWSYGFSFLEKHKIDFVAHDDIPYQATDTEDVYQFLKEKDMFLATQRTEGVSTTDIIGRIVRDYDNYVRRNIRRGLSRNDLNISYVKEKTIQLQDKYENLKKRGKDFKKSLVDKWEEKSNDIIISFAHLFDRKNWFGNRSIEAVNILTPASSPVHSDDETSPNEPCTSGSNID